MRSPDSGRRNMLGELAELESIDNGKPVGMSSTVDIPAAVGIAARYGWRATKLGADPFRDVGPPNGRVSTAMCGR